jgi:DNA processing protein
MSNLKHWIWLTLRKGLAGQNAMRVLERFGTPELVHAADEEAYRMVGGLPDATIRSLMNKSLDQADVVLGDCERYGIQLLTLQDAAYPERLKAIAQPPLVLYWKGRQFAFDNEAAIGMVGSRQATPYGVQAAMKLSADLTRKGALVVTGMAQGIDASAVRGALKVGGPVVSVLAGGIDRVYPAYHKDLYEDVAAVGALVSEYPPGTDHAGGHFPVRNRIISGLSVGVIAVESARASGTLLTVNHALDQNREVFAVPGPIGAPQSEGVNRLIQEGCAKLIMEADDVLCEFADRFPGRLRLGQSACLPQTAEQRLEGAAATAPEAREARRAKEKPPKEDVVYLRWSDCKEKLTDDQRAVLLALDGGTLQADDLVERTQIPARRVLSALTVLQIQGYAAEESGKRFRAAVKLKME